MTRHATGFGAVETLATILGGIHVDEPSSNAVAKRTPYFRYIQEIGGESPTSTPSLIDSLFHLLFFVLYESNCVLVYGQ
jgi:hypothetical protein